jgi:5-methylcytosine-specific restriction endonuclease McrA
MEILVLNSTYQPINTTTLARGFKLVFKGKAEILEHLSDSPILTDKKTFQRPTVIRLLKYVSVPYRKIQLNRQNILIRDGYKCAYCGSENRILTLDHIMPKSRGGRNTWENLITSCGNCNVKKNNRTPEEANMTLLFQPFKPSYIYFVQKLEDIHFSWKGYIGV